MSGTYLTDKVKPVITQWNMAWDSIDLVIITKSFKKCSISNDLDSMEDDVL